MTYGERLRELRAEQRLSLRQVEERGGPNKDTMSLIERDVHRPHPQTLGRIAQALEMSVGELRYELEAAERPLAQAPPSQEKLFNNGVLQEERRYSEFGLGAAEDFYERALEPVTVSMRALVETFEPILDDLHEPPLLREYPKVQRLFEAAAQINKTLIESGLLQAANELLAESKRGGPDARELGRRVRTFHTALVQLNEQAERAREWALRVPEIAELRERGLRDEDLERELRGILSAATAPQTTEQREAESR